MSRSIHTTYKDLKGLTKREIDEQFIDPYSDLAKLGEKGYVKRTVIKNRKHKKTEQSMTNQDDKTVKILFRFHSDVLDEETVETMWATIVDKDKGLYKLDNIPFYAPLVASDDIVFAEFDDQEQMLTYRRTVEYSGNSTVQIVLMDKSKDVNQIRDLFKELGCISEKVNERYFSMEIPSTLDYINIKKKLDELEIEEIIGYAEPCLSDVHRQ